MTTTFEPPRIEIELRAVQTRLGTRFEARQRGQKKLICRSTRPFIESARILAQYALNVPGLMLYAYHEGQTGWCLRGRLADVNKISVVERKGRELRGEKRVTKW